jgi:hypothetical protein
LLANFSDNDSFGAAPGSDSDVSSKDEQEEPEAALASWSEDEDDPLEW